MQRALSASNPTTLNHKNTVDYSEFDDSFVPLLATFRDILDCYPAPGRLRSRSRRTAAFLRGLGFGFRRMRVVGQPFERGALPPTSSCQVSC